MSYIPTSDAGFDSWLVNFATLLTADPSAVGETAGTAAVVQAASDAWEAAYAAATDPSTRTTPTVAAKNNARASATATVRPVAIRIRDNSAVTDAQRADYGLTIVKTVPTPIPAPTSFPILGLRKATPLQHTLQYSDSEDPDGKAKPFGVIGLELWRAVGEVAAVDPAQATYYGTVTKSPYRSNFISENRGKICTYFGRWVTRSGTGGVAQTGPWSAPLDVTVI